MTGDQNPDAPRERDSSGHSDSQPEAQGPPPFSRPPTGPESAGMTSNELVRRNVVSGSRILLAAEVLSSLAWALTSFLVLNWLCQLLDIGDGTWVVLTLWTLSGLIVLWPQVDGVIARYLFRVRRATLVETERMAPGWSAVAMRAGVVAPRFSLWVQESTDANAIATGGATVAVTRWALYTVPPAHLEAVLARELMTHLHGGTWFMRLANWYSVPARLLALGMRALLKLSRTVPAIGCTLLAFLAIGYFGIVVFAWIFFNGLAGPLLFLTPIFIPLLLIGLRRWTARLADRGAADLGYGQRLIEVLYGWQKENQPKSNSATQLDWVPGVQTSVSERIRALEVYQQQLGRR